jgi:hypothetical protein
MTAKRFVGRDEAVRRLKSVIVGEIRAEGRLTILSIEGSGGIGKTFLLDHVLGRTDLIGQRYLTCRLSGSDVAASSLVRAVVHLADGAQAPAVRSKPSGFYFPMVHLTAKAIESVRRQAITELQKRLPDQQDAPIYLSRLLDLAFQAGKRLNDISPATRCHLNFAAVEKTVHDIVPTMKSLVDKSPQIWQRFGFGLGSLCNAVKENACRPLSDALVGDLSAILHGYRKRHFWRPTPRKIPGVDRLLLILDDYEALQKTIGEFLVGYLVPALREAEFDTTLLVIGRDRLEASSPRWQQQFAANLLERIELSALSRSELDGLVEAYGVDSAEIKERALKDTQGFPYYVELWMQEAEETKGPPRRPSALMLQMFHDRTTRWMNDEEKEWLRQILFLDAVHVRSLERMLTKSDMAKTVFTWFERERSVRDVTSDSFRVREFLRSRLVEYIRVCDPDLHDTLKRRGEQATAESG